MSAPIQNLNVVSQGLARLTSAYITKPNVRAMLAVYLQPLQDLENATFGVLQMRQLNTAQLMSFPLTNVVFDNIGALVGVQRGGLDDFHYRTLILLEIAVNGATGRTEDWSKFASILKAFSALQISYADGHAAFEFGIWNLQQLQPVTIAGSLAKAVPNGVRGVMEYTTWPDIGTDVCFGSIYDSTAGQSGLGSVYDVTAGGVFAAAVDLSPPVPPGGSQ